MSNTLITVFGASKSDPGDGTYEDGIRCGRLLAEAGYGVVTGGYGGLMEAVSQGANRADGHVLGVTVPTIFTDRPGANEFVLEERRAAHLVDRIHKMTDMSAGVIVLPGSLGTMTELAVAWNLAFVGRFTGAEPKPVVTVGATWSEIVHFLGTRLETDISLVQCAPDIEAAVDHIRQMVPVS